MRWTSGRKPIPTRCVLEAVLWISTQARMAHAAAGTRTTKLCIGVFQSWCR